MTPEDLVKTGAQEAFRPFAELITKLLGPAFEEVGEGMRAMIAPWRLKRQLRFWTTAQRMIKEAGIDAQPVPPKILGPILQHASLEDSDDLQDRWAALLANAAQHPIHPSLPEILTNVSSTDAKILTALYEETLLEQDHSRVFEFDEKQFRKLREKGCVANEHEYGLALDNLVRLNLLQRLSLSTEQYWLTNLGVELLTNCTPPQAGQPNARTQQRTVRPTTTTKSPAQQELEALKFLIITENVVNNYLVHLGELKKFWARHHRELEQHPQNLAFFNEWLQHPYIGQRIADPQWTVERSRKLKQDASQLKI